MSYQIEQRVRHRVSGDVGTIVAVVFGAGPPSYRVAFPKGVWQVPHGDVVAIYDDPFALLANPPEEVMPYEGWLRQEALRLRDAYRNDPTAALSNSRIEPQHHQISVAIRALAKSQARLIIADEVGLGKTIEAGLILKELRARGVLERVLILAPASLVTQWQQELRSKFNEVFVYYDGPSLREVRQRHPDRNPWDVHETENVIASLQYARLEPQCIEIADSRWDLVIVDEAHHARRRLESGSNLAYDLLEALRDEVGGLLLLTATPMQLETYELYSMVELVEPGLFEDYAAFEQAREEIAAINSQVAWLRSGPGSPEQQRSLAQLLDRWSAPNEVRTASTRVPEGRDAVYAWLESRHLLSEAMVRNRKAHVGGFMKREARRISVEPTPEELALERDVQDYLRREYARSPAFGLILVAFQKLLASSSRAIALALERRAHRLLNQNGDSSELTDDPELLEELLALIAQESERAQAEADELHVMAGRARAIRDAKLEALDETLDALFLEHPNEKVLIFTQYLGTVEMIRERLAPKFRVELFHGGMNRNEKDAAASAFKSSGQILISTEAGGEGRNFQFCHILFNYDLPWNPMRIEQRIGRLDRVGQKRNVLIYNFGVRGTLDERILDVLEHRIRIFTESVGALEPILGDIEERIKEICLKDARNAVREFRKYELDLDTRIRRAREKESQMADLVMDAKSFRRDEVERLLGGERLAGPEDLEAFILAAFARYPEGSSARVVHDAGVYVFDLPGMLQRRNRELEASYRGTFDYRLALEDETLDFFAFGHPVVDEFVASLVEDVAPLTVLEADGPVNLQVDYELQFSGVRDREELLTHRLDASSTTARKPEPMDLIPMRGLDADQVRSLEEASQRLAAEELERRLDAFRSDNRRLYEEEQTRLEKLFSFQRRHFELRIGRTEAQIDRLERWGDESERRVLPALRGRIDADRRRVVKVGEDRERALADLALRREPAARIRPIGVTLLVPSLEAACAADITVGAVAGGA